MSYRTAILFSIFLLPVVAVAQPSDIRADPDRMEQRIKALSVFGANPQGGVSRVAFSAVRRRDTAGESRVCFAVSN